MNNIRITQIGTDGDNNAFFPSPGGGKICTGKDGKSTIVAYASDSGAVTLSFDGEVWSRGALLPISRPYMVVDSTGFIHIFGPGEKGVWHFQSQKPNSEFTNDRSGLMVAHFDNGERIYPPNYSAAAIDAEDTLYYFGAGLEGFAFMKKPKGGSWTTPFKLVTGGIYPGVFSYNSTLHLIYCGWNPISQLYEGVYYMKSEDKGETWQKSDGTSLNLPVQHKSGQEEQLCLTQNTGGGEANTHDLCIMVDREGKVHVLYWYSRPYFIAFGTAAGGKEEPNVRVKHLRLDKDGWKHNHLCEELDRDVAYAVMTRVERSEIPQSGDNNGRIHAVVTHKHVSDAFYDVGYLFSDDNGEHWSAIQSVTTDANKRKLSYAHPAINHGSKHNKIQFVFNMWTGKNPSPIYYGEVEV
jgi:hypothetical protein